MEKSPLPTVNIVNSPVTALPFDHQINVIVNWAQERVSKFVCVANVHMLMEAHWNPTFRPILEQADIVTPDGMPLVWMLRLMGFRPQDRVAGMDILLSLCQSASEKGMRVFFVGSTIEILDKMRWRLHQDFPNLQVAGMESLPFRPLTQSEDEALIETINSREVGLVFIALGCPKQEYWMAQHKDRIQAVMIGVGAVFSVYAGLQRRAPTWVRELGLEWLYRLIQEPRRLWKRYIATIPPFIWLAFKQILGHGTGANQPKQIGINKA